MTPQACQPACRPFVCAALLPDQRKSHEEESPCAVGPALSLLAAVVAAALPAAAADD